MPKFNDKILLWMANKAGESFTFKAFNGEKNPIEGLFKRLIFPKRFQLPIARIYQDNTLVKCYIQGIEVSNLASQAYWYGPDISLFKLKLILKNDNSFAGPFYSNSTANKEDQKKLLIDEYCNGIYKGKFSSAIVVDIQADVIVERIKG